MIRVNSKNHENMGRLNRHILSIYFLLNLYDQACLYFSPEGGYGYSTGGYNPWPWLASQASAEAMAVKVATWPNLYKCDGIDLVN